MASRTTVVATPLAYRVDDAAHMLGLGKSKVWELIQEKRLGARKIDGATVITHKDLEAFLASTPPSNPTDTRPMPS